MRLFPKRLSKTLHNVSRILAPYPSIVFVKFCKARLEIKFFSELEHIFC